MHFHVEFHHLVHIERLHAAGDGRTQCVADKVFGVMIVEEIRIVLEDGAFLRLFDVVLDAEQALFAHLVQELVHHFQGAEIARLSKRRAFEHAQQTRSNPFQDVDGIGHEQSSNGSAAENEQFGGLNQNHDVAFLHQKAADDCPDDDNNAYDGEHESLPEADVMWFPPA